MVIVHIEQERLQRQFKAFMIVNLILIIGTAFLNRYIWALVAVMLFVTFYFYWVQHQVRSLQPSNERLSLRDSMTPQALAYNPVVLWLLEIVALGFVAAGIFILLADPGEWLMALITIILFGLCAVAFACMLVLQRQGRPAGGP